MDNSEVNYNDKKVDNQTMIHEMKPHVMKNFEKELKRTKWPTDKKNNKNFFLIFVFILILTGFFALISLGATEIIKLIGAK